MKKAAAARRAAPLPSKPQRAPQVRQQPESLRLRSAGPSFTVNDIQKSLAFYRDVLGFTLKERWEEDGALHGVEMVAGSVTFWLGQDDWKKGRDRVKGQGFRMYCGTSQDIDAIAQRIRAAGGTLLEEPKDEPWGDAPAPWWIPTASRSPSPRALAAGAGAAVESGPRNRVGRFSVTHRDGGASMCADPRLARRSKDMITMSVVLALSLRAAPAALLAGASDAGPPMLREPRHGSPPHGR